MGQTNTKTKEIDGLTVEVTMFKPRRALRVVARLIRTLGPAVVPLVEAMSKKGAAASLPDMDARQLLFALQSLTDDDVQALTEALLEGTVVSGHLEFPGRHDLSSAPKIDLVFADLVQVLKACAFSLEVNFASFSAAATTILGGSQPAAKGSPST